MPSSMPVVPPPHLPLSSLIGKNRKGGEGKTSTRLLSQDNAENCVFSGTGERIKRLNKRYLELCKERLPAFRRAASFIQRELIAESIVKTIIHDRGGLYLDKDYEPMPAQKAVRKTSHALKDLLAKQDAKKKKKSAVAKQPKAKVGNATSKSSRDGGPKKVHAISPLVPQESSSSSESAGPAHSRFKCHPSDASSGGASGSTTATTTITTTTTTTRSRLEANATARSWYQECFPPFAHPTTSVSSRLEGEKGAGAGRQTAGRQTAGENTAAAAFGIAGIMPKTTELRLGDSSVEGFSSWQDDDGHLLPQRQQCIIEGQQQQEMLMHQQPLLWQSVVLPQTTTGGGGGGGGYCGMIDIATIPQTGIRCPRRNHLADSIDLSNPGTFFESFA